MRISDNFLRGNWKRALGELALIVVGVTIALWADSWVAERSDRQRELARLAALHDDASESLEVLAEARRNTQNAADAIYQVLVYEPPYQQSNELLELLRHALLFGSHFRPEVSVYEDLKSSGELALLTSADLRQALSRMSASLEKLRLAQADLAVVQQLNFDSYMMDHIDLRPIFGLITNPDVPEQGDDANYDFVGDSAFQNRLLFKHDLLTLLAMDMADVEASLQNVLSELEIELER